jgi:prepilin-type N-terminal cleavage/methylation domain-containing protein
MKGWKVNNAQEGFTLIEIAIVLVIVGLLLGGVVKGQELISGARVRNLISQQDGVKAAFSDSRTVTGRCPAITRRPTPASTVVAAHV